MKIILKILKIVVGIIALLLIVAIFPKAEYSVQREVTINKPVQEVFGYTKLIKNNEHYNKWWKADPGMKKEFRGTDGAVGFIVAWDSKDGSVGKGEQEIKNLKEGEMVDCEIRFERPFEGLAQTAMTTEAISGNQTKVKWVFNGRSKYPMKIMNLFIDNLLGKQLQASLGDLKAILEK